MASLASPSSPFVAGQTLLAPGGRKKKPQQNDDDVSPPIIFPLSLAL